MCSREGKEKKEKKKKRRRRRQKTERSNSRTEELREWKLHQIKLQSRMREGAHIQYLEVWYGWFFFSIVDFLLCTVTSKNEDKFQIQQQNIYAKQRNQKTDGIWNQMRGSKKTK